MIITLNDADYKFSDSLTMTPKESVYDMEIVEPGFNKKTKKFEAGGVDAILKLPRIIEREIKRTSELPVAKIFIDAKGNKMLSAYFD